MTTTDPLFGLLLAFAASADQQVSPLVQLIPFALVLAIFILPALAISWFVPSEQLSLTAGIMQAFEAVFAEFGWQAQVVGMKGVEIRVL